MFQIGSYGIIKQMNKAELNTFKHKRCLRKAFFFSLLALRKHLDRKKLGNTLLLYIYSRSKIESKHIALVMQWLWLVFLIVNINRELGYRCKCEVDAKPGVTGQTVNVKSQRRLPHFTCRLTFIYVSTLLQANRLSL